MDKNTYRLYIYKPDNTYITIEFDSKESKDFYVKKEYIFTRKEYSLYSSAMTIEGRKESGNNLEKAKLKFAKLAGYGPTKTNKYIWKRLPIPSKEDDEVA